MKPSTFALVIAALLAVIFAALYFLADAPPLDGDPSTQKNRNLGYPLKGGK